MNIQKLNTQLYYHPSWPNDKNTFIRLLNQSNFTDKDIKLFARLYVKYSHLHCFESNELTHYFTYMLGKMGFYTKQALFQRSHAIYKKINIH